MKDEDGKRSLNGYFSAAAQWTSQKTGHALSFIVALLFILVWALLGPMFKYSDTWQLVVNTATTIVTFLMVFLIQNTQNRDMSALHLKLDELIRVNVDARNKLLTLEDLTEEELLRLKSNFEAIAAGSMPSRLPSDAKESLDHAQEKIEDAAGGTAPKV